ncbi:hypothetical protein PT2222_140112 [Paraburkholderia tropica]
MSVIRDYAFTTAFFTWNFKHFNLSIHLNVIYIFFVFVNYIIT